MDEVDVEALREYCTFDERRVYVLVALSRAKDDPSGEDGGPTIRKVVAEPEDLRRKVEELAHAVSRFDRRYRLYVSANARDAVEAIFALRDRTDGWIRSLADGDEGVPGKFKRVDSEFKSVLQTEATRDETNFLFDLDDATGEEVRRFRERLAGETTVRTTRETPNGYHVVTDPFDYTRLDADVEFELKTDGLLFVSFLGE